MRNKEKEGSELDAELKGRKEKLNQAKRNASELESIVNDLKKHIERLKEE